MVDAMIRLFPSSASAFESNGLGSLGDAVKCEVVEETNGAFELEMQYHISGRRYRDLRLRQIIVAKPNPYAAAQPFRIYEISKPINGLVTVKAEHISYDMAGYPVSAFTANSAGAALSSLKSKSISPCPFTFSTDNGATGTLEVKKPASMRSLLSGADGTIQGVYGGEYEFDGYHVTLHANRGSDRGVTIRYGKNMTDLTQEENCSNVYTEVYPFWYSDEWGLIELPEKTIKLSGTYDYTRVYPLDVSDMWENTYEWEDEYPSEDEVRELANQFIKDNSLGVPKVSLTVSFELLSQAKEFAALGLLETVRLCDTVHVEFPELGVSAASKCVKTTYDALNGKYVSIELGEPQANLADGIVSQNAAVEKRIEERPTKSFMAAAVDKATQLITGGLGGYVVIRSSTGGDHPDEILIMDTDSIETATKVWRWNKGGLGYSSTGYNGKYTTAITQDGGIVADFINTGSLTASVIRGGTLTIGGLDNEDGVVEVRDAQNRLLVRIDVNGMAFYNGGDKPVTSIVKNTVTTDFINALKVVAGSVAAENITGTTISGKTITGGTITGNTLTGNTIDGEYITGGTIDGSTINGCIISSAGPDDETMIWEGVIMTHLIQVDRSGGGMEYASGLAGVYMRSPGVEIVPGLHVHRGSASSGSISSYPSAAILSDGRVYAAGAVCPESDEARPCGASNYKWSVVYAKNGQISTSDRNRKHDIRELSGVYEELFFRLKPVTFMFDNGDRVHIGVISQDLKAAMDEMGLNDTDVAAFCRDVKMKAVMNEETKECEEVPDLDEDGNEQYEYGVRYSEFIMLNTHMIQGAYKRIEQQEKEIAGLKKQLADLLLRLDEDRG